MAWWKSLPDFRKGYHSVPDRYGRKMIDFLKVFPEVIAANEIEEMSLKIKDELGYIRKEMDLSWNPGLCRIETPDFIYTVEVLQNDRNNNEYFIKRSLDILNSEIIYNEKFNEVF